MATLVEYGVNDCDAKENPFERNFDTQEEAEQAGREYLRDNPECSAVVIFELTIVKDTIVSDNTLRTIKRDDLSGTKEVLEKARALGFETVGQMREHQTWLEKHGTPEYHAWAASIRSSQN